MTRIWERLYVGGRDDAEHLFGSNPEGISTVISLCEEPVLQRRRDVNYLHIPIADATPVPVRQFDAILDAIAENIRWGVVLLHCGAGVSRSPIMAAGYMHAVGYKNIDAVLMEIAKLRPTIDPSPILVKSVKEHLR
jgi:atypical dual specificity phosphatase